MRITGAQVAIDATNAAQRDFRVRNGRVEFSGMSQPGEEVLDLSGYLILPGLINAHDHLELNLFPQLGSGRYTNARAWAEEIYRPDASPVKEHLALGKRIRLLWGGLKNLLSGATTVAHHNPYDESFDEPGYPVRVVKRLGWAHSLDFSPDLATRYHETPQAWPFVVHAAEGTDRHARSEIARLDQLGVLTDRTVLVHAVAVERQELELLQTRRSALAWCPTSNLSLYGETLRRSVLKSGLRIALGTDSAMTNQGDFCDEMDAARTIGRLEPAELYEMVTVKAARALRLNEGRGSIREGGVADLIALPHRGQTPAAALEQMQIEMVMVAGCMKLASERVLERRTGSHGLSHTIELEGRGRWHTCVDMPSLCRQTIDVLGPDFRMAGKRVTSGVA
ncbi:MAG TPA: amidohydrolase family protein [Bryobacteraceae bacterium]|nr:amidohydrolase family protein [Bryobacteraceae bacterium]